MKKITILTIESQNYGNRLQNYALQHMLESMCFICVTIRRKMLQSESKKRIKQAAERTVKWRLNKFLPTRTS